MSRALALAFVVLAGALVALALADEARAATVDVTISGSRFAPQTVEVRQGDTVRWSNNDAIAHTARSSGTFDTGTIPANGGSASVAMEKAGTFSYVCAFHASMTGTVRVLAISSSNSPPAVTITAPGSSAPVTGVVSIVIDATDADADPLTVSLRIDGGAFTTVPLSGGAYSVAWDTLNATNGPHTLTARATDGKETTTSGTRTVTVNNAPTITLVTPGLDAHATIGSIVPITGTTTSPYGSSVTVEVSIADGPWEVATGRTFWTFAWNTTNALPGDHSVQARVRDSLNIVTTPLRVVTLEEPVPDQPPVILLRSPMEGAPVSGLVNVTGNASDADGSMPFVEVSIAGGEWRPASGRAGGEFWYHWLAAEGAPGAVIVSVRATSDDATTTVTRRVVLTATEPTVIVEALATREASPILVRVLSPNGSQALSFARVVLVNTTGDVVHEAEANATGIAAFPPVRPGSYEARAYVPGATGRISFEVRSLYQIEVEPEVIDFERPVAVTVSVRGERGERNVPVQLFGPALAGGRSDVARTGGDGNASVTLPVIASGEVAVYVSGNDTGLRVRIAPTILVTWTPPSPIVGERVTGRFTLNDPERTPLVDRPITVDVPGMGRMPLRTDHDGAVRVAPNATGTLRALVPRDGFPGIAHLVTIRAPAPEPELSGFATRAGPALLQVSVLVKNAGDVETTFTLDALASDGVTSVQRTARTAPLLPGEEKRVGFNLRVGQGEYDVVVTVRNSSASLTGVGRVADGGVPPPLNLSRDAPVPPARAAAVEEEKDAPGATLGALAALGLVALVRRRR